MRNERVYHTSVPAPGLNPTGPRTYHSHHDDPHGHAGNGNPHAYEYERNDEQEEQPDNNPAAKNLGQWDAANDSIKIDESIYNHKCLTKVLNEVLALNDDLIHETVSQFSNNSEYDLEFTIGECSNGDASACTDPEFLYDSGKLSIKIQNPNMNPIDLAQIILHESIHAEIFRYVKEHREGYVDPNNKPKLFEYYKYYKLAVEEKRILTIHIWHPTISYQWLKH